MALVSVLTPARLRVTAVDPVALPMLTAPVPREEEPLMTMVPALSATVPENVFLEPRVRRPSPFLMRPPEPLPRVPERRLVLPEPSMVRVLMLLVMVLEMMRGLEELLVQVWA